MGIGFGVAKLTQKPVEIKIPMDTRKYDLLIDSVFLAKKQSDFIIGQQTKLIDSLNKKLNDKTQLKHETKQIKDFTPSSRAAWNDSVLRANGRR